MRQMYASYQRQSRHCPVAAGRLSPSGTRRAPSTRSGALACGGSLRGSALPTSASRLPDQSSCSPSSPAREEWASRCWCVHVPRTALHPIALNMARSRVQIRLLVSHWRSEGLNVLVCAASAKAARLIGGHTVHSAFKLRLKGGFYETQLDGGKKHTKHWAWLFTRDVRRRRPSRSPTVPPNPPSRATTSMPPPDLPPLAQVIVIDEVSMLTAGALHGVNHALNHVMSLTTSAESTRHFGSKSVLAVGDLFQLPAVEKHRFKEQVRGYQLVCTFTILCNRHVRG